MPFISVVIPVYNVEKYIRRCLDSVIHQSYGDYEVICIDDCSPDDSENVLVEFEAKYPNIIKLYKNESNLGLGLTRERGIQLSKGQYILFIDSDDYISSDYIETYVEGLTEPDIDIVIGGYTRDIDGDLTPHPVRDSFWSLVTYPIAWAKLFKKSFLVDNRLQFSDIRCGEDIYFSLGVISFKPKYKVIPYTGYHYFYNKNSITGSMTIDKKHEEFVAAIFTKFMNSELRESLDEDTLDIVEYSYLANMLNAMFVYNKGCGLKKMRSKVDFFDRVTRELFPNIMSNRYISISKSAGQDMKIRAAVFLFALMKQLHCERLLFYVFAIL